MRPALIGAVLLAGSAALAQDVPRQTRSPLGAAIRDVLVASPDLLAALRAQPPGGLYAGEIARDRALLDRLAPRLFDPARPALGPEEPR